MSTRTEKELNNNNNKKTKKINKWTQKTERTSKKKIWQNQSDCVPNFPFFWLPISIFFFFSSLPDHFHIHRSYWKQYIYIYSFFHSFFSRRISFNLIYCHLFAFYIQINVCVAVFRLRFQIILISTEIFNEDILMRRWLKC